VKITLIKPTIGTKLHSLYVDEGRMEPLQLGVIAAMLPDDIEITLYDDRMEKINYNNPADLVMLTVETFTAKRAYEIASEYKKRGVKVAMGGVHATLLPDEVAQHCDCTILSDAETVLHKVIEDFKNGNLQKIYTGEIAIPPQSGILTRRDLFKNKGYLPMTLAQFSRGCPHGCTYCATSKYFSATHNCRKIDETIKEIEAQGRRHVFFVDDNFTANKAQAKEFLKALIPLKIRWASQGSVDMLYDDELMELIVKSGGLGFVMGFESLSAITLDSMNKNVNKMQGFNKYEREVKRLRHWGLQTWSAFTLGYDTDTVQSIKELCDFAIENKFAFAAFNVLMPYPNTPLYEQLEREGRLLYDGKWWLHNEYKFNYAPFIPKNMTPEELTDVGMYCRSKFSSIPSILSRVFDPKTHMSSLERFIIYWMYTPLFRKEVHKKHGMTFGLNHFLKGKKR
jgi:radical SAM superfamily enzyme YgiQ (UPF0313 family)